MKAIVYTKYGSADVLQLKEVDKPVARDDNISRRKIYPREQAAEAHRKVETEQRLGIVVIAVGNSII